MPRKTELSKQNVLFLLFSQVKRKRESSELSGDEGLFMNDPFSSTMNSSGINDMNSSHSQSSQHHQQMQHYGMMQQSADHSGEGQAMLGGHQLQQLVKLQPGTAPGLQIQSQVWNNYKKRK